MTRTPVSVTVLHTCVIDGTPTDHEAPVEVLTPDTNGGRNPGDVWTIPTSPFPQAHYAVMAPRLAERLVTSGCKPGGVVLDPFSGAGTTGMVAGRHGRRYIGIDASTETLDLSLSTRLAQGALMDGAP